LKNWDEAIRSFEQAVSIKNDLANSHYNLSAAYREKGDFEKAASQMEMVIQLVPASSEDWSKAKAELEALNTHLKNKVQQTGNIPSESLTTPEPLPAGLKPPLTLPTDAAPEVTPIPTEVTPTPSISL
jgi:tetratricopeptide (TPR) repeat protein